jgi:hypothetical protein
VNALQTKAPQSSTAKVSTASQQQLAGGNKTQQVCQDMT